MELVANAAAAGRLDLAFAGDDRVGEQQRAGAEARVQPGGEAVAHQQAGAAGDHRIGRLGRARRVGGRDRDPSGRSRRWSPPPRRGP